MRFALPTIALALALAPPALADEHDELVRQLSVRDPAPSCEQLEQGRPDPVAALARVVDEVQRPPWAPMRAATCLVTRHPTEVRERMVVWVSDPSLRGLAILSLNHLDQMPEPVAIEVASAALLGPSPEDSARRIRNAAAPAVRALANAD